MRKQHMPEHQGSRRVGPPQGEPKGKVLYMPLLIYVIGMAIEWGLARLACGGMYW